MSANPVSTFSLEPYVDAQSVADHLAIERRQVLNLTRAGKLPAHPVDPTAKRKQYRYKLSEVDKTLVATGVSGDNTTRQPRGQRG